MKVSVVISFYNSHGVLARQVRHFRRMALPADVEFLFVDDGSDPPFRAADYDLPGLTILRTENRLAWTQGLGRNLGAAQARGAYLLMTDADHILSREAIEAARAFSGDRMQFPRYFGVLLEDGTLSQDREVLRAYGLDVDRLKARRGLYASVHQNTFALRKSTFETLGGYAESTCTYGYHPISRQGDDCHFNTKWNHWAYPQSLQIAQGPPIYLFPTGRFHVHGETNPFGLFHDLHYDGTTVHYKGDEYPREQADG